MIKQFATFSLLLTFAGCTVEQAEEAIGPNGSWWLGGADGGVYILVRDDAIPNDDRYEGSIYYGHDQSIAYQGAFKLVSGPVGFSPSDRTVYEFWDGERLHVVGEGYLEPTEEVPKL